MRGRGTAKRIAATFSRLRFVVACRTFLNRPSSTVRRRTTSSVQALTSRTRARIRAADVVGADAVAADGRPESVAWTRPRDHRDGCSARWHTPRRADACGAARSVLPHEAGAADVLNDGGDAIKPRASGDTFGDGRTRPDRQRTATSSRVRRCGVLRAGSRDFQVKTSTSEPAPPTSDGRTHACAASLSTVCRFTQPYESSSPGCSVERSRSANMNDHPRIWQKPSL